MRNEVVAIYARQSLDKKDSVSIEAQVDACVRTCNAYGWKYYIYDRDKGYSGKNLERPCFKKMMSELEQNNITMIMAYKLDRISRSIADFSKLVEELKKRKVEFCSVTENIDTSSPMGRAMINIIMTFAQLEREQTSQRVSDNTKYRMLNGQFIGGKTILGYDRDKAVVDGKKRAILVVNETEAHTIKKMFSWYLEPDGSMSKIAKRLNEQNITTKSGYKWDASRVRETLSNPTYCKNSLLVRKYYEQTDIKIHNPPDDYDNKHGMLIYNRLKSQVETPMNEQVLIVGDHEGIIEAQDWLDVRDKIKSRKSLAPRFGQSQITILAGLVRCEKCGAIMHVSNKKDRVDNRYFVCANRHFKACDNDIIRVTPIENKVEEELLKYCSDNSELLKIFANTEQLNKGLEQQREDLELQLKEYKKQMNGLFDELLAHTGQRAVIDERIDLLQLDINKAESELKNVNAKIYSTLHASENMQFIIEYIKKFKILYEEANFEERKNMVRYLIKNIYISKEHIKINFFMVAPNSIKKHNPTEVSLFGADHFNGQYEIATINVDLEPVSEPLFDLTLCGDVIKFARLHKGLTRYDLCSKIGCTYSALSQWEVNHRLPQSFLISRLESVLDISLQPTRNFGQLIKGSRISHGFSVKELARSLDIAESALHSWEREATFPNPIQLRKINEALGLDLQRIVPELRFSADS